MKVSLSLQSVKNIVENTEEDVEVANQNFEKQDSFLSNTESILFILKSI
jgi:hypothetical protein